jgi:hypothetical protein
MIALPGYEKFAKIAVVDGGVWYFAKTQNHGYKIMPSVVDGDVWLVANDGTPREGRRHPASQRGHHLCR